MITAFGEIMLRLSAQEGKTIADSTAFGACYGGTEANVLACLENFGRRTRYLTALPDTSLGRGAVNHLQKYGIDTSCIIMCGDVMGIYFSENGDGSRATNVEYLRKHSEFAALDENSFDFNKIFDGTELFHISGISLALSQGSAKLARKLMREARSRGVTVSFDFNYRAKLWDTRTAAENFKSVIDYADIVLASKRDLEVFLDATEENYFKKYSNKYLFLRNRTPVAQDEHCVQVSAYRYGGESYRSPAVNFKVKEKIGCGDAFDGAVLHCLLRGDNLKTTVDFAISAFALKHTVAGDTFTASEKEVEDYKGRLGVF